MHMCIYIATSIKYKITYYKIMSRIITNILSYLISNNICPICVFKLSFLLFHYIFKHITMPRKWKLLRDICDTKHNCITLYFHVDRHTLPFFKNNILLISNKLDRTLLNTISTFSESQPSYANDFFFLSQKPPKHISLYFLSCFYPNSWIQHQK